MCSTYLTNIKLQSTPITQLIHKSNKNNHLTLDYFAPSIKLSKVRGLILMKNKKYILGSSILLGGFVVANFGPGGLLLALILWVIGTMVIGRNILNK